MKRSEFVKRIFALSLLTSAAGSIVARPSSAKKILIIYLSRTNNTKAIAEIINKEVSGDLLSLELVTPYPKNYKEIVEQVATENKNGYLPPLKTQVNNIQVYDKVFIGYPTWDMQLPPPVKTFLSSHDLKGKTIIPFNTNAGYGLGASRSQLEKYCAAGTLKEILSVTGGRERDGILFVMEGDKLQEVSKSVDKWLNITSL